MGVAVEDETSVNRFVRPLAMMCGFRACRGWSFVNRLAPFSVSYGNGRAAASLARF